MNNLDFYKKIKKQIKKRQSHICVGLDSEYDRLPNCIKQGKSIAEAIFTFNKQIIDHTHNLVVAYKPNIVFYAAYGIEALRALRKTNEYIKQKYPEIMIIADCKRSEMGKSAEMAAKEIFDYYNFDAIMVTPWFGSDTLKPYLTYKNKGVFVYCHNSNSSAHELQDCKLVENEYLYERVTKLVCNKWNSTGNVFIEAGLTYPKQLKRISEISSNKKQLVLIAGLGAQKGDLDILKAFKSERNFVVSASRSIIFASKGEDFAQKAKSVVKRYKRQVDEILS